MRKHIGLAMFCFYEMEILFAATVKCVDVSRIRSCAEVQHRRTWQ